MSTDVYVGTLTRFETADDGTSVTLVVKDSAGRPARLLFPIDCLTSLIMTLPGMVTSAIQRRQQDNSLRVVFPLGRFEVERGLPTGTRILTLETTDGFSVSFSLDEHQYRELGDDSAGETLRFNDFSKLN